MIILPLDGMMKNQTINGMVMVMAGVEGGLFFSYPSESEN
jgi:hypothetical protein